MDKFISNITLEINGVRHLAQSVTPSEETYRTRVNVMGGSGFIENQVEHGLDVTFVESKIARYTPDIRDMTDGTITIVYDDNSREVYNSCVTLSKGRGGYNVNQEATLTYTIAAGSVVEA